MAKIQMTTPLVEMDGDEMTRILWSMIKDELLLPFIDLKTEYYDLGLEHRNETDDQVTADSAVEPVYTQVDMSAAPAQDEIASSAHEENTASVSATYAEPQKTVRTTVKFFDDSESEP